MRSSQSNVGRRRCDPSAILTLLSLPSEDYNEASYQQWGWFFDLGVAAEGTKSPSASCGSTFCVRSERIVRCGTAATGGRGEGRRRPVDARCGLG